MMSVLTESKTTTALATARPQILRAPALTDHDASKPDPTAGTVDTDELIRQIARFIKRETNLGVRELRVSFENNSLILHGYCQTYYTKQLAQHAALTLLGNLELVNNICVVNGAAGESGV